MVKLENEYFIRLYLLLIKGGGEILRQIIRWGLERQKLTLEEFMTLKKDSICTLERIKQTEITILYHVPQGVTDLSKWDISLPCCIAVEFFKNDLKPLELQAVEKIKEMRNKLAHHADASIDFYTYNSGWTKLTLVIYTMAYQMDDSKKEYLTNLISSEAEKEPLDIRSAIEELKTLDRTDELIKSLGEVKTEISEMKRKIEEISKLKQEIRELKELMENLGKSTDIRNKSRGAIHVSAEDQDVETAAQSLLISAATDSASSSSHGAVKEKVDKLVEEIKGTGAEVEEVTTGSVIFSFECSSIKSLLDLIDFFESPNMQNHLDEISAVLGDILGHKIDLTAHMITESLQDVVKKLKSMTEKRGRSLQFSMTCRGVEGLQHALDVFEGDAASNSLNDLAKTLSEEVGKPVIIETSIDIEEMQKAIQTTKQQIESELRDIQDSGVETTESGTEDEFYESEVLNATFCSGQLEDGSICNQLIVTDHGCETCGKICRPHSRKKCAQQTESEACSECDRKLEADDSDIQTENSSVIKSSDMMHDFVCTPCSEDGRSTEAFKYCVECQSYFCKSCLQQHSKFPPLKKHILLDKADIEGATRQDKTKLPVVALPSDFCSDHPGNVTQIYCRNHDVVCCTVCIALDHRSCEGVEFIPKIATKELLGSKERTEVETSLVDIRRELDRMKHQITNELNHLSNAQYNILKQIQNFKARLLVKLGELERKSEEQVRARHKIVVESINRNVGDIEQMLKHLETHLKNITNFKGENDAQLFVYIKHGQKFLSKCSDLLQKIKNTPTATLKFDFNYDLEVSLNEMQSFISIHTDDFDKTSYVGEYDIRLQSDICNITACCIVDDGTLVIADTNNNRLKRLNQSYRLMDWRDAPGGPSGLCQVGPSEIAVSMYYGQKVQFATVGNEISLKRSFPVNEGCLGICCNQNELFISCTSIHFVGTACYMKKGTGHVRVYTLSGALLRILKTDHMGHELFLEPCNIAISRDGTYLYIADVQLGLIILDRQGNKRTVITDPKLKGTFDVCLGNLDQVFVCGRMSHNVTNTVKSSGKFLDRLMVC
ncbi:uncharacterized protein LOC123536972 [Mercenaria mercenaria]|uniref:uncharacterized protein LOC123536972 n=1 Tax=Mercenaria mercenaria TaxID=6596 RepID=UPI00234F79EE|nr:uncharacterized protein LOC123536972 [Mercenaria mercenaria]